MTNGPADILAAILTEGSNAIFTPPAQAAAWPLFVDALPDGAGAPDNAAVLRDTAGQIYSVLLASQTVIEAPGVQLIVRSQRYSSARSIIDAAVEKLRQVHHATVLLGDETFRVDVVRRTSTVLSLGHDERRRPSLSVNFLVEFL